MKTKMTRMLSLSGLAASALVAAAPVWAHDFDDDYRGRVVREHYYHGAPPGQAIRYYRYDRGPQVVVVERPVVMYRAAPPVYYYDPLPPRPGWGTFGGAITGAALGSRLGQGNGRTAAIAIGSVMGAFVGDRLSTGR